MSKREYVFFPKKPNLGRKSPILVPAFWNFKLKVLKYPKNCRLHATLIPNLVKPLNCTYVHAWIRLFLKKPNLKKLRFGLKSYLKRSCLDWLWNADSKLKIWKFFWKNMIIAECFEKYWNWGEKQLKTITKSDCKNFKNLNKSYTFQQYFSRS